MIYYSELYKDIYNLTDRESKFFELFFNDQEIDGLLGMIKKRIILANILSILSIVFIPALIIGLFYLIYRIQHSKK